MKTEELILVVERQAEGVVRWQLRRGNGVVLHSAFIPPNGMTRFSTAPSEPIVVNGCAVRFGEMGLEIDDRKGRRDG